MRHDTTGTDGTVALPAAAGTGPNAAELLPGSARLRALLPSTRTAAWSKRVQALVPTELGAREGRLALGAIAAGALAVVVFASAGSSILVPRSTATFPHWESGPLGMVFGHPGLSGSAARLGYTALLLIMISAYFAALLAARSLSMRTIWAFTLATALILLLGPPLQLNDVWNYLGYSRLGALHHLDPYVFRIRAESNDPIFTFTTWRNLSSPYGPLFSALSYPLAFLPIPIAYWLLKLAIVGIALAFVWTVGRCARLLGRDPRFAVLLIVANPVFVFYALGGFHNDFLMLLPSTAAVAFLLQRRDRMAGGAVMLAVAIKLTAIVLLPFLLIAARPPERRLRVIAGCVIAGVPLLAMDLALFGFATPNIAQQSRVVTPFSFPNLLGLLVGLGGSTTGLERLLNVGLVLVVLWGMRNRDWLAGAGWATLALVASVSWLMPWYIVWVLPLAGLSQSRALRRAALVVTVFLVLSFLPETGLVMNSLGIQPMGSATDEAALALQGRLQGT